PLMSPIPRRSALGILTVGVSAAAVSAFAATAPSGQAIHAGLPKPTRTPEAPSRGDVVPVENRLLGSPTWRPGAGGTRAADDRGGQIQGYASTTSAAAGETVDFHVSVNPVEQFSVTVHRLGWYGGATARPVLTSPTMAGVPRPVPVADPETGLLDCRWPVSWSLRVPDDWLSGLYVAVFTTTSGWRSCTPFVVRDDRHRADFLVVLPFSTYQAYNLWPLDGRTGKSLYYGYAAAGRPGVDGTDRDLVYDTRAVQVSFDRPYSGDGQAKHMDRDHDAIQFLERQGYDVTYASTVDLHTGRIDPARYHGIVFVGHDEYWSAAMRQVATKAVEQGTGLAFLTANNVYWQMRMAAAADQYS
ncbi:N,N-dimethylformamidase beta subunit family domain-containing protein, partial [Micromonospora echinofusca]